MYTKLRGHNDYPLELWLGSVFGTFFFLGFLTSYDLSNEAPHPVLGLRSILCFFDKQTLLWSSLSHRGGEYWSYFSNVARFVRKRTFPFLLDSRPSILPRTSGAVWIL